MKKQEFRRETLSNGIAGKRWASEDKVMNGVQFLTDEKGRKTSVIIDLKKHKELWEDLEDVIVSRSRQSERRTPLAKVKADLMKSGKLRG